MIVQLDPIDLRFPDPHRALGPDSEAPGLLAVGGDLRPERLIAAYRQGIFPWFGPRDPILWWCLNPRMVLKTPDFQLPRSLKKRLRAFLSDARNEIRVNADPVGTLKHCARTPRPGQTGTWIVPAMQEAYAQLVPLGVLQSIETWMDGRQVGGLYGLRLGGMFFGESMFALQPDASKMALAYLVALCRRDGIEWIDCQQETAHLARFGAAPVPLDGFLAHLRQTAWQSTPAPWTYDPAAWSHLLS